MEWDPLPPTSMPTTAVVSTYSRTKFSRRASAYKILEKHGHGRHGLCRDSIFKLVRDRLRLDSVVKRKP